MNNRIWLSPPHMGGNEELYVKEAFDSNWVAPLGANVDRFEEQIAAYCKRDFTAALSSGTAAIHLALIVLGVESGDEVIASSFTFSATVNPIRYQGALPVLVDSELETWNMCPELLEEAIQSRLKKGKKPKAIIVVHLYGMPARMEEILQVAQKYEIPVIEDAAEALGSLYKDKPLGSFGRMSVLSFNGNKIITTSGGGALLADEKDLIAKARYLATQAKDKAPHYQHNEVGFNYRMSNILAGIGRGQMEVLHERVKKKREIFRVYKESLSEHPELSFLEEPGSDYYSNRWLTTVRLDASKTKTGRERLRLELEKNNIESRPLWKPMHQQPVFSSCPSFVNGNSDSLFREGLCLPSGTGMTEEEMERVIGIVKTCLKK